MATRVTAVGTQTSSDFLSFAEYNDAAGGAIGYAEITASSSTFTGTSVSITSLTLTFTPTASRIYRVAYDVLVQSTVANDSVRVFITDGSGTGLTFADVQCTAANGNMALSRSILMRSPAAVSTTWKIMAQRIGGSGNCIIAAAANTPAYMVIEDLGPTF